MPAIPIVRRQKGWKFRVLIASGDGRAHDTPTFRHPV
jgi:hypothetical protein